MIDVIGQGSLMFVSGWSASRSLDQLIERTLTAHAGANDVRRLHDQTYIAYADAEPSDVRNWLAEQLAEDESVFVVEFEHWSSHGPAADRSWLLRRGH